MQLLNVTDVVVSRGAILTNPTRKQQVNDLRSSVVSNVQCFPNLTLVHAPAILFWHNYIRKQNVP